MKENGLFSLLFGVGSAGMFTGWLLFIQMTRQLNQVLPPEKRIPLVTYRYRISEIKCLHEAHFPGSVLRGTSSILRAVLSLLRTLAVIVEIAK